MSQGNRILSIEQLTVKVRVGGRLIPIVDGLNLAISPDECMALVGESGSGKSVTALSIMKLLPQALQANVSGSIRYGATEILSASDEDIRRIRGQEIAMVFQDPASSLNPRMTVGDQLIEAIRQHQQITPQSALERAKRLLERVNLAADLNVLDAYPHQLSGGMRQRVMIAIAISCDPKILIADEPTTALDVSVQAEITDLLSELRQENRMSMLFVSHNLNLVADVADRISVMYFGNIVESGATKKILERPEHPYTIGLLGAIPGGENSGKDLVSIRGNVPDLTTARGACAFQPRCPFKSDACSTWPLHLVELPEERQVACCNVSLYGHEQVYHDA